MILAKLADAGDYRGLCPALDLALEHLTPEFLAGLGEETVRLDGERVYANRFTYDTIPEEEGFFEAHRRYLDIHVMLEGEERVDIAHPDDLTQFDHRDDFYALRGNAACSLILRPGWFLAAFPGDAHHIKLRTGAQPRRVTKAVFKVLWKG